MGRDISVNSKHFCFCGSKSSDLIILFDGYFIDKLHMPSLLSYERQISRKQTKELLDYLVENKDIFKNYNDLYDKINNIYIRMMPKDVIDIHVW